MYKCVNYNNFKCFKYVENNLLIFFLDFFKIKF